jgi:hypothetical protein
MWRNKQKLYPKLKNFFEKSYLYSQELCLEKQKISCEHDEKRYICSLQLRYDYIVSGEQIYVSLYHHTRTEPSYELDLVDIWYCKDVFSRRLVDQLRFSEIGIATINGFNIVMDYYHNHFAETLVRKFDIETDE